MTTTFSLSFDYRCPFANIIHQHVVLALQAGAPFDVTFVPWTLSQGYKDDADPDVWDDERKDAELLSLAVGVSVRDQQPEHFLAAHDALFRARHVDGVRLVTNDEIASVLAPFGVDLDAVFADVASRRPHAVIGDSYRAMSVYDAFGVPTFVVNNDATFVRYMTPPTGDASASTTLITSLVTMMAEQPALNEFKHTRLPA